LLCVVMKRMAAPYTSIVTKPIFTVGVLRE
jgi:hypothetical protein